MNVFSSQGGYGGAGACSGGSHRAARRRRPRQPFRGRRRRELRSELPDLLEQRSLLAGREGLLVRRSACNATLLVLLDAHLERCVRDPLACVYASAPT